MLATKIKEFRIERGMTQQFLADKLNVYRESVARWENGTSNPTMKTLTEISRVLNQGISEFFIK